MICSAIITYVNASYRYALIRHAGDPMSPNINALKGLIQSGKYSLIGPDGSRLFDFIADDLLYWEK